jgi:hypothetical protein
MKVERYDASKHTGVDMCSMGNKCRSKYVTVEGEKATAGYCSRHLAKALDDNPTLRHSVIFQLLEKSL